MKEIIFYLVQSLIACCVLVWAFFRAQTRFPHSRLSLQKKAIDLVLLALISGLMGARLGHVFFEYPDLYLQQPTLIFALHLGGYVYYSGFLFAFAVCWLWVRYVWKDSPTTWLDFSTPLISFGTGFGRLGCFIAGCCFGKSCDLPWAMAGRHPTQLYSFFSELILLTVLLVAEKKNLIKEPGSLFFVWLLSHASLRFIIEFWRDDFRGQFYFGLSLSQLISLCLIVLGLFFMNLSYVKK